MATKISVYSLSELKSTLDDHLPLYLTSPNLPPTSGSPLPKPYRLKQSNFHATVRLALGYTAVSLALYIVYLDYYLKVPWLEHKVVTFWAVLGYTILNGAIVLWTWGWERGLVFEGWRGGSKSKEGKNNGAKGVAIKIRSLPAHRKYDPTYRIAVEWTETGVASSSTGGEKEKKKELTAPYTSFYQADGTFVSGEFERWLRSQLPEILGKEELAGTEVDNGDIIVVDSDNKTGIVTSGTDGAAAGVTPGAKKRSKTKS